MVAATRTDARVRAPELLGRRWLNTGGATLSLAQLRGRFVLLDFWTFACVNCLHVIEELRPLQERFADRLVTIGVHSPKFAHEGDPRAVNDAVTRYRVEHPVLDDAELLNWDRYAVKAWPTLVLIDPAGYVVAQRAGEGHAGELAAVMEQGVPAGRIHPSPASADQAKQDSGAGESSPPEQVAQTPGGLRFPGGLLVLPAKRYPGGGVLVSDTANQQLVILSADAQVELARVGSGRREVVDGAPDVTGFADPLGTALLPLQVAQQAGYDVLVADSVGNALRGLRLADLSVRTVAGQLSTPWDVAWWPEHDMAVIAMAGIHQLWFFSPQTGAVGVLAGTAREGLVDGAAATAWFAQPSGLAVDPADGMLWVVDAETSALRRVWSADDNSLQVSTAIGQGLFEFGSLDGDAAQARLQHPLGVAVLPDGSVAIADTFNGAVRRYHPATDQVSTLVTGLAEPAALVLLGERGDSLLVAESAAHRLRTIALSEFAGPAARTATAHPVILRPVTDVAPGQVWLSVDFRAPAGEYLDRRCGDPTRLDVSASPPELLLGGAGQAPGLQRALVLADRVSGGRIEGELQVSLRAVTCDAEDLLGAACHLHRRTWRIPVRLIPGGSGELPLPWAPV